MKLKINLLLLLLISFGANAQFKANESEENVDNWPERVYDLTIDYETVNYTGKDVKAMTFNGSIPGPISNLTKGGNLPSST